LLRADIRLGASSSAWKKVQGLRTRLIVGAFKIVAGKVAVDEAGLAPVEESLSKKVTLHLVNNLAQEKSHLARAAMEQFHGRGSDFRAHSIGHGQQTTAQSSCIETQRLPQHSQQAWHHGQQGSGGAIPDP